jgi:hypothetical protein
MFATDILRIVEKIHEEFPTIPVSYRLEILREQLGIDFEISEESNEKKNQNIF